MSSEIRSYRDLVAWQRSMEFAVASHRYSTTLPRSEQYELASQIRRAASSVPLNVAEGFGQGTDGAFLKHLRIARGSAFEVQTAFDICTRLELAANPAGLHELAEETVRIIQGLIRSIESRGGGNR